LLELIKRLLALFLNRKGATVDIPSTPIPTVTPVSTTPSEPIISSPPVVDTFSTVVLPLTLIFEGGFSDNPSDHGGRTNKGIIQVVYDKYRIKKGLPPADVKDITNDEVRDIYYNDYYLASQCDKMPEKLSVVVFDTSVNSGPGRSIKTLQQAIGAHVDGVIGQETLSKLKSYDPMALANSFLTARNVFYNKIVENDPTQQVFLKGWLRRWGFVRDYVNGVKTLDQIRKEW